MISFIFIQLLYGPAGPRQLLVFLPPLASLPKTCPHRSVPRLGGVMPTWRGSPAHRCAREGKKKKKKNRQNTIPPSPFPGGGSLHQPRPYSISCGGPWPPLLPDHLVLLPFSLSSPVPRRDSDRLPHPRLTEEGQDRFGGCVTTTQQYARSRQVPP